MIHINVNDEAHYATVSKHKAVSFHKHMAQASNFNGKCSSQLHNHDTALDKIGHFASSRQSIVVLYLK